MVLNITKGLLEGHIHRYLPNEPKRQVEAIMIMEDEFCIMAMLSTVERKVPFFFLGRIKFFNLHWAHGDVVLKCIISTHLFNEYREFFDSKNIQYAWNRQQIIRRFYEQ